MSEHKSEMTCRSCGSQEVYRIHRSVFDKLLRRPPKYRCARCRRSFFRRRRDPAQSASPTRPQDGG